MWYGPPPPFYPEESLAIDRCQVSEVAPRLFLTNYRGAGDAAALKKIRCTHIASIGDEFEEGNGDAIANITYYRKKVTDDEHEGANMASSLREAADFIAGGLAAKRNKGVVVVHCAAGISRSTTVVLA